MVAGRPDNVLEVLTEPNAIARWAPVEFELVDGRCDRLRSGDSVRVRGFLAGRCLEFSVDVHAAARGRLSLTASGPIELHVEYLAEEFDDGSVIHASVEVSGRGLIGRLLAQATDALLAAGALHSAVGRIARELESRVPCGAARELESRVAASSFRKPALAA
jgi:hypothetical protein